MDRDLGLQAPEYSLAITYHPCYKAAVLYIATTLDYPRPAVA